MGVSKITKIWSGLPQAYIVAESETQFAIKGQMK
jgi:hypothetical protein